MATPLQKKLIAKVERASGLFVLSAAVMLSIRIDDVEGSVRNRRAKLVIVDNWIYLASSAPHFASTAQVGCFTFNIETIGIDCSGSSRMMPSKKLLPQPGVTEDQVNYFDRPTRVTRGSGNAPDLAKTSLTDLAVAEVGQTVEPMHHRQLRHICDAFLGSPLDEAAFLQEPLRACCWARPGYRRARMENEPAGTNLKAVFLRKHEVILAGRQYLQEPPGRLVRAYDEVSRAPAAEVAA